MFAWLLSLLAHDMEPGDNCWIHADPVNLQADMDRAILSDSQTLRIRQEEAEKLVNELNKHFAADDLSIVMADENNWFIMLEDCNLETTPLSRAVARNINHLMPTGEAAAGWRRLLNEAQMLLHMSEVNQRREESGETTVNSLWLWGEGALPHPGSTWQRLWLALWRPLGCGLNSQYERNWDKIACVWRQNGRHVLRLGMFEWTARSEAILDPEQGCKSLSLDFGSKHWQASLISTGLVGDQGIPGWQSGPVGRPIFSNTDAKRGQGNQNV